MRFFYCALAKVMTFTLLMMITPLAADARAYLAVVSGSFSNSDTWGGVAPTDIIAGDEIIIPSGVTVTMDKDVIIDGLLTLDAGVLALNGHNLGFGAHGDLLINGGAIRATQNSNISIAAMDGFISNLTFTPDSKIGNLTINTNEEGIYLGSDLIITGTLALLSGNLGINNHELYFAGKADFSPEGTGQISSTPLSDIGIFTSSNLSSPLRFSNSGNLVRNFTVNCSHEGAVVRVSSDLNIAGSLVLASGKLDMGEQRVAMMNGQSILSSGEGNYVAKGKKGKLKRTAKRDQGYFTANAAR